MITFYVLVSAWSSEKWQSKTLFSWKKISLPDAQIGQNYTSYYQRTFSESNRLIVSVICCWSSIKAISITAIVKNTSSIKQNNWTTSCTQNEIERAGVARQTMIWPFSSPEPLGLICRPRNETTGFGDKNRHRRNVFMRCFLFIGVNELCFPNNAWTCKR